MTVATSKHEMNVASRSDIDLAALAHGGSGAAFREIMQRNNQRLYRLARSVVRNDHEAEDVVQEAYCRAFAALGTFRGESSLSTWLSRIAINEALSRRRRQKANVELEAVEEAQCRPGAEVIAFPLMSPQSAPERAAAQMEMRRTLEQAIDGLPEAFRVVFALREVEGLSTLETADLLGIRHETVKTRLHRAKHILKESLERRMGEVLTEAFPFGSVRCARLTAAVLERLHLPTD